MAIDPQQTAVKVVREVWPADTCATSAVVCSSIDLELQYGSQRRKSKSHQRTRLRKQFDQQLSHLDTLLKKACEFANSGKLAEAREHIAERCHSEPQSIWWCESRQQLQVVVEGIYERLSATTASYDAYDFGRSGQLAWVCFWQD